MPLPGTLITRMYKGRQLQVRVVTGGFEYEGELFKSLSAVAKKITGSHWSGNKFFQVGERHETGGQSKADDESELLERRERSSPFNTFTVSVAQSSAACVTV